MLSYVCVYVAATIVFEHFLSLGKSTVIVFGPGFYRCPEAACCVDEWDGVMRSVRDDQPLWSSS